MTDYHGSSLLLGLALALTSAPPRAQSVAPAPLFCIGEPDAHAAEFGLTREGYAAFPRHFSDRVVFTVGASRPADWPFIHPAQRDVWAGSRAWTFEIRFSSATAHDEPLYLVLGTVDAHRTERSAVHVRINGEPLPIQTAPPGRTQLAHEPRARGWPDGMIFELPKGSVVAGANSILIRLEGQSWIIYDYVALHTRNAPLPIRPRQEPDLLAQALRGPLAGAAEIVFAVRQPGRDEHWYANFSYYAADATKVTYGRGGRLCRLNLRTGELTNLIDDPAGGVRDPVVHHDGQNILLSYRKGDSGHYHLYEIGAGGDGLRQLTGGDFDDIEPIYLPDGGIMCVSSRSKRWVNCWLTQVATLHRCDADGGHFRELSSNNNHDNTPWMLHDGRVLYQRWEYVDRSQVHYHHLWSMNPDGSGQMVFYGNLRPGTVMIDAKAVPDSDAIVAIFSPGHGRTEHDGAVVLVDASTGPDDPGAVQELTGGTGFRDPFPLSGELFLVARGTELLLLNGSGDLQTIWRLPDADVQAGLQCHEPRPLRPSVRAPVIPPRIDTSQSTGRLILADVYQGRNMAGIERGDIQKLLVLEVLPKPINYTGGMEPLSYGGTFALERVVGTVPVESDGSAYVELPALRSFFFVALDEQGLSVKRMQSFLTVQPGEVMSCVGCHEQRTTTSQVRADLLALRRPPSAIEPIPDVPEVFDFPRDIQPILDGHCVACHGYEPTDAGGPLAGGINLSGDRGPMFSHSYFTLSAGRLFSDGRNEARSNYAPRTIGSSASRLVALLEPSHHGVQIPALEARKIRLWIDSGAAYPGTYAALGTGMIGGYERNQIGRGDLEWPATKAAAEVLDRRCSSCHGGPRALPGSPSDNREMPPWGVRYGDIRLRLSRHILYNLSRPEHSMLLLAPLPVAAGGLGRCRTSFDDPDAAVAEILTGRDDPDYGKLLAAVRAAASHLDAIKRFDMPGFRPRDAYLREMQRYGVLPAELPPTAPIDPYATDEAYWRSLWYDPARH